MATYPHISRRPGAPTSVHAEMTILGAMLVEPVAIIDATMLLKTDDFALDSHRKIYAAMLQLVEAGSRRRYSHRHRLPKQKKGTRLGGWAAVSGLPERRSPPQTQHRKLRSHRPGQEPDAATPDRMRHGHDRSVRSKPRGAGRAEPGDEPIDGDLGARRHRRLLRYRRDCKGLIRFDRRAYTSRAARSPAWRRITSSSTA